MQSTFIEAKFQIIGNGGTKMFTHKKTIFLTIVLLFALVLSACEAEGEQQDLTPAPGDNPAAENGEGIPVTGEEDEMSTPTAEGELEATEPMEEEMTPTVEEPVVDSTPQEEGIEADYSPPPVSAGERLPITRSARIMPETARPEFMHLSNWMELEVVDTAGVRIGSVDDYVLNTCEAHIIYVAIQTEANGVALMPYEVVTLGGGILDADHQVIAVPVSADEFQDAPTIDANTGITDVTWETETRNFWSNYLNLSNLTTECTSASDGTVLIDYASNILEARIQDGNGEPIGNIEEVILFPETGLLRYMVINIEDDSQNQGYRLAPLGAVNIESQEAEGETVLVLLVERQELMESPAYDNIPETNQENWDAEAFDYWSQYVPMTQEALPE
jgi:sporulation protein YlmC with PRC-barrel domain